MLRQDNGEAFTLVNYCEPGVKLVFNAIVAYSYASPHRGQAALSSCRVNKCLLDGEALCRQALNTADDNLFLYDR